MEDIYRRQFHMHLVEWTWLYFDLNSTEVYFSGFIWQKLIIDSCNGLSPVRRQAITWTKDDDLV